MRCANSSAVKLEVEFHRFSKTIECFIKKVQVGQERFPSRNSNYSIFLLEAKEWIISALKGAKPWRLSVSLGEL